MALIDQPDVVPGVARHAWLALLAAPQRRLARADLERRISPTALGEAAQLAVRRTIDSMTRLGLFSEEAGTLRDPIPLAEDEHFEELLRRLVLDVRRHPPEGDTGAQDLQRAVAWFLTYSPWDAPSAWDEAGRRLQADFGVENDTWPIRGSTRWPLFARWATILGFAQSLPLLEGGGTSNVLVPDPTVAIDHVVRSELEVGHEMAVEEFVRRLNTAIPVLPGGAVSVVLPEAVQQRAGSQAPVIGHALTRLGAAGRLELVAVADPTVEVYDFARSAGATRLRITHLTRKA